MIPGLPHGAPPGTEWTEAMIRRTMLYSGRVQGVGFRYTTCRVAEGYRVVGFVRNLADGRVEATIEGEEADVDAFGLAVGEALRGHIEEVESRDAAAAGEFSRFEIRF